MSIVNEYRNAGLRFVEDDKFKMHSTDSEYHLTPVDMNKVNSGNPTYYSDEVVEFAWRTNTGAGTSYCGDIEYEMRSGDVYTAASQNVALSAKNAGKLLVVKWRPVLLNQVQIETNVHVAQVATPTVEYKVDDLPYTGTIDDTITQRGERYGKFKDGAEIMQELKNTMRNTSNWSSMSPSQRESLEMIQHKIGRILNGDPNYDDNWRDICGYSQLVLDELNGTVR